MFNLKKFISVSAVAMLGATNMLAPLSYANAAPVEDYDAALKTISTAKSFSFIMPDHDVWLYAVTAANHYIVDYYGNTHTSGTMSGTEFTYDLSGNLEANDFKKTGYTFQNWNTQTGGGGTSYTDRQEVKNLTTEDGKRIPIYAQWTANGYTIKYVYNDSGTTQAVHAGSHPTSATYDSGFDVTHPSRTGYSFSGWDITNMDGETHYIGSGTSTSTSENEVMATSFKNLRATSGEVTFEARWNAGLVNYKIEHYLQELNGTYPANPSEVNTGTWTADEYMTGHTNDYTGFTTPAETGQIIDANGNTVFIYKYPRRTYTLTLIAGTGVQTVTLDTDNSSGGTNQGTHNYSVKFDDNVRLSYALKEGYEDARWTGYEGTLSGFEMPSTGIVKEAYAVPHTYRIDVDLKGGTGTYPTGYNIETTPNIVFSDPNGTNSDFLGWIGTDLGGTQPSVTIPTGSTGDRSYTAQWKCRTGYHPISSGLDGNCIANDDTTYTIHHQQQQLNSAYSTFEDGTGVGTTSGSTSGRDYVKDYEGFTVSSVTTGTIKGDGSTEIYIKYDRNSYNIAVTEGAGTEGTGIHTTVVGANDEYADAGKHQFGDTITLSHTEDDGYTFDHWVVKNASGDVIATLNSGNNTFTMPASDVTIESYSTTNVYKVGIDKNGGTGGTNSGKTYTVVDTVTLVNPSRDHSTFVGWSGTDLSGVVHDVTFSGRAKDSYYEAIWSCVPGYHTGVDECVANDYTVSIDYNYPEGTGHGSATDSTGFTYDQTGHIANPEESGYTFVGWTIEGMTSGAIIGSTPAGGTTATGVKEEDFKNLTTTEGGTVTFKAVWEANNDTEYKVYYYTANLDSGYTRVDSKTMYGTSDTNVSISSLAYDMSGYTTPTIGYESGGLAGPSGSGYTQIKIDRHGTTEIHIYYTRTQYRVYLSGDAHVESLSWTGDGGRLFKYQQEVTVSAEPMTGYHFVRWEKRGEQWAGESAQAGSGV